MFQSLVPWLVPPGIKSLTLSVPMQQGPAVFVFGPSNPIVNFNPFLDMVRTFVTIVLLINRLTYMLTQFFRYVYL